jgi:hypothetical protein
LETPATVQQSNFGGFDPFQQQRLMQEQEQQRIFMEQQMMQQQMYQQQEMARQQELMRQQQQQQEMLRQQQQQAMMQQSQMFQSHPNNPFSQPFQPVQRKTASPEPMIDFSSNPNAILDPFAAISTKQPQNTNNPFSTPLVNLESLNTPNPKPAVKNPFDNSGANKFEWTGGQVQPSLAQLASPKQTMGNPNAFGGMGSGQGMGIQNTGQQSMGSQFTQQSMGQQGMGQQSLASQFTGQSMGQPQGQPSYGKMGMQKTGNSQGFGGFDNTFNQQQQIQPTHTGAFSNPGMGNPFGQGQQGQGQQNIFGQSQQGQQNQFGQGQQNTFGQGQQGQGQQNIFGQSQQGQQTPFGQGQQNTFGQVQQGQGQQNIFGQSQQGQKTPFGQQNPFQSQQKPQMNNQGFF